MFDYFSIELSHLLISELLKNSLLNFVTHINEETGELVNENFYHRTKEAKYKNLLFSIHTNTITQISKLRLKGSIHVFHKNGTNHTDFNICDLREALNDLKTTFNIDLYTSFVHSIEFGVNIYLHFSCSNTLDNLISYRGVQPRSIDNYYIKGHMVKFQNSQYTIKIYNKGLQYFSKNILSEDNDNLMRYEIKVHKMAYLHNKGINIRTLSDLLNPNYHSKLGELLIKTFDSIVIYEPSLKELKFDSKTTLLLSECNNPKYWKTLRAENGRKQYDRKLNKFRTIVSKYINLNTQCITRNVIKCKWSELTKDVPKLPSVVKPEMSRNYPYIVGNNGTSNLISQRYYCKVTGIDITHQSGKRIFLSKRTIDRLEYKNPALYYRLLLEHGPKVYDEMVNYYIAHNIRNRTSNEYHTLRKRTVQNLCKTAFFRGEEVIHFTQKQLQIIFTYNQKQQ